MRAPDSRSVFPTTPHQLSHGLRGLWRSGLAARRATARLDALILDLSYHPHQSCLRRKMRSNSCVLADFLTKIAGP